MGSNAALPASSSAARAAQLPNVRVCIDFLKQELAHGEFALWTTAARGPIVACGYGDLEAMGRFDLVVNATSASLTGDLPPVPPSVFSHEGAAYELAYGKRLTPFLRLARNAGVRNVADGVGMLVEQAAEAFDWWRGVRPKTRTVIDRLTVPLD